MNRLVSHSPSQTAELAVEIHQLIKPLIGRQAVIIALEGELGSGKTTFTKALAHSMGIKDVVVSPTFTLNEEYEQFDHIDAWRMESSAELLALGLERMIKANRVIVIEWAEKVRTEIENYKNIARIIWIKFEYGKLSNERGITYEDIGH